MKQNVLYGLDRLATWAGHLVQCEFGQEALGVYADPSELKLSESGKDRTFGRRWVSAFLVWVRSRRFEINPKEFELS